MQAGRPLRLGSLLFELVTGQCITSLALGYGPTIVQTSLSQALAGRRIDLSSLRSSYANAYLLFEQEMATRIRPSATNLIKQLCDPVPENRLPRSRINGRRVMESDLEWLLRRADILARAERTQRRAAKP